MRKTIIIIFFIMTFFICQNVKASDKTLRAVIHTDSGKAANVRKGPGTQNDRVAYAQVGALYNLVSNNTYEDTNNHKDCNADWYQIYYNGIAKGYVCGEHVEIVESYSKDDVKASTSCEKEMAKLGFPSSYWGGLCNLKEKYPNWSFVVVKPKISWPDVIDRESECNINLITNSSDNESFIDNNCPRLSKTFVPILPQGVAYYMDPRNFLSERYIFQFMHLAYDKNFVKIYDKGTTSILKGTAVYEYHLNRGNDIAEIIKKIGQELEVSPIFTAARIVQELGSGKSEENLYSGVYEGFDKEYYGYYNFYNIGVSDSCVKKNGREYCGLNYAKNKNWNSVEAGISGGISFLANSYIKNTQYTGYFQKFDVNRENTDEIGGHQYMANIEGAQSEAETTYTTYKNLNILKSDFIFYIPVYDKMDATINNESSGVKADEVENSKNSETSEDSKESLEPEIDIPTIITSSGYRYEKKYISKIKVGTEINDVIGSIESIAGRDTVKVLNKKDKAVTDGIVATGYKVVIKTKTTEETLTMVIKGDTSGDGKIDALDLLQVQKNILGSYDLEGANKKAADTSSDGKINALDLLQVQKSILGSYKIKQ